MLGWEIHHFWWKEYFPFWKYNFPGTGVPVEIELVPGFGLPLSALIFQKKGGGRKGDRKPQDRNDSPISV